MQNNAHKLHTVKPINQILNNLSKDLRGVNQGCVNSTGLIQELDRVENRVEHCRESQNIKIVPHCQRQAVVDIQKPAPVPF